MLRSEIWDAVLRHLSENETVELGDLVEYEEDDVVDVLRNMEEKGWVRQLSEDEWYVGIQLQNLRK